MLDFVTFLPLAVFWGGLTLFTIALCARSIVIIYQWLGKYFYLYDEYEDKDGNTIFIRRK